MSENMSVISIILNKIKKLIRWLRDGSERHHLDYTYEDWIGNENKER
jgi:hypothetical protein